MAEDKDHKPYVPTHDEIEALKDISSCYVDGRSIIEKNYAQFNGRSLIECINDWEKRWNGWIPSSSPLIETNSMIFLNFTRNAIISYISKTSMQPSKAKINAVNKKNGTIDRKFAKFCEDIVKYSQNEENSDAIYRDVNLERTIKGTCIVYEGYAKNRQKMKIPNGFDMETGKGKFKEEKRIIFEGCFERLVKLNHFYVKNPYLPPYRLQEQPWIMEDETTTYSEAKLTYGKYKNWDCVIPGAQAVPEAETTFYENDIITNLKKDQVQILKLFKRFENIMRVWLNGVIVYDGPIPFKDGRYPYAAYIFEPAGTDFFWGLGFPNKIMGEQDSLNTQFNVMGDKQIQSLVPTGISSDQDDLIDDDTIQIGKFRKVSDINNWKWFEHPEIGAGEANFLQQTLNFARSNSGDMEGLANTSTPKGGKVTARQILLKQQEAMQRMEFSMSYMEDGERDRVILRLNHLLQFTAIPKLEKTTDIKGKEIEQLVYRDIKMSDAELSDGKVGNKTIKLIDGDSISNPDQLKQLQDQMSVEEAYGEMQGIPTEVLAVNVDTFFDHNLSVQVLKNSSFTKNQALDQAMKHEFAEWLQSLIPLGLPVDVKKLAEWVGEGYDADVDEFLSQPNPMQQNPMMTGQQPPQSNTPLIQGMGNKQMKQPALSQMMG
jgi:hypothetical protein